MLQIEQLAVNYGAIQALKGVSLTVAAGEVVTLIGGNGAGKSTLMKAISGLEPCAGGHIAFEGQDLARTPAHRRVALGIAQSPEGRQVFPDQSVRDNLLLGAYLRPAGDASVGSDLEAQFTTFPRLRERQHQMAGTLSGGEQQMLAIGRALMARPRLLLLDEPSLGLAPLIVKEIFGVIRALKQRGMTILLVEQMANQALKVADRAYVLKTGEIASSGPARALLEDPAVREAYLGKH
ncbi:ABC-type branched-chain amino acid transport system, ATPase component [Acidovorax sp. CF316]|uniref:ABC transporter ATP-binding protein n=1 Tax=Acidovorax sp. CF316 TaxID=1144317 RepID=UPI00026BCAC7|nr:ABC transporter ATP-binding protein [Acidovorax sp. CF316]EJE53751.1 ABC-type branched-chain amino acid transport system, ATPase component [Acidovorax sp. CF316]